MSATTVVKLGGSLAESPHLPRLLAQLARLPNLVIAPGGGPFADAVRRAQSEHGFDDTAAHDMALLAMAQFGRLLAAQSGFRAAWGTAGLHFELAKPDAPSPLIWLPNPFTDALEVERSWRISGDSLALWLARWLGARRLVLLKSCPIPVVGLQALAAEGIVDELFPRMAHEYAEVDVGVIDATRAIDLQGDLREHSSLPSARNGKPGKIAVSRNRCFTSFSMRGK